ncbi:MAG TPA: response regulator [Burkholderiales bacterium]|jgi:FixJ family two-component response regulator|nr:response regulator [Burkholderiales bacterium]
MNDMHPDQQSPIAYVVDDDESIRALWRWLMESNGIAVRTFATAAEFIESYRNGDAGCLVLDLKLPGMSGLELQEYLNRKDIEIPIVFVTGHGDVPAAVSAIKGGAIDFIQKPFSYRDVLSVIEKAFERDAKIREKRTRRSLIAGRLASLTDREREVLQRVIDGKQNKVIARELDISVKTVEFHRAKMMEKAGVHSVAELVQIAMQTREPDRSRLDA